MVDVDKLSDAELRTKLLEFGFPVMPITGTTRKVMAKKLKLLLENKNKISNDSSSSRRSLGRYSSEEESDTDAKSSRKDKNRRATMAAPLMQPPQSTTRGRRSTSRLNETLDEVPSPPKRELKSSITTTTRSQKIVKTAQDEFDTGSDSESDLIGNNYNSATNNIDYSRNSPVKSPILSYNSTLSSDRYSPQRSVDTSYSRTSYSTAGSPSRISTYTSPLGGGSSASEYASERLNQIRSRLSLNNSVYDRPTSYTSAVTEEVTEETPFLSNFTKKLSALSHQKKDDDFKNDVIKEYDLNGTTNVKNQLKSYRAARGRDTTYDYRMNQNSILRNNFVSFAVLAGAAMFFIILAATYLSMKTDTAIEPAVPPCVRSDPKSKRGVNCLEQEDLEDAINLLKVVKPELNKKAVANKCYDSTMKSHMTEGEIVTYCTTNFAINDEHKIRRDLRNLEVLTFYNPDWNVRIVQTPTNDGLVYEKDVASNMEEVIFNLGRKNTSLVIFSPELPWKCRITNTLYFIVKSFLFIGLMFGIAYVSNLIYKYYRHYQQKQKDEVGFMVERIIDVLQTNANEDGEKFVVINHVRDMILPVADRKRKERTWAKAVKFINENESRVRTEVEVVHGEPYDVWRWIGRSNLSMAGSPRNKCWQGQAFETQVGSVNSLPVSPTPCLKVRGMVEDGDRNTHIIREAVLGKCAQKCRILHCGVDVTSKCVYIKCADQNDAAIAYRNLHGWWYAGHLVTVKYLRLERYMQRFPDSPVSGPPFLKAISPSTDWVN